MIGAVALAAALTLLAPGSAGASRDPASLAIAAWPARVVVVAPGRATIHVDNPSDERVAIDAAPVGIHARPPRPAAPARPRRARAWLAVHPAHLTVPARSTAASVGDSRPARARTPGRPRGRRAPADAPARGSTRCSHAYGSASWSWSASPARSCPPADGRRRASASGRGAGVVSRSPSRIRATSTSGWRGGGWRSGWFAADGC